MCLPFSTVTWCIVKHFRQKASDVLIQYSFGFIYTGYCFILAGCHVQVLVKKVNCSNWILQCLKLRFLTVRDVKLKWYTNKLTAKKLFSDLIIVQLALEVQKSYTFFYAYSFIETHQRESDPIHCSAIKSICEIKNTLDEATVSF